MSLALGVHLLFLQFATAEDLETRSPVSSVPTLPVVVRTKYGEVRGGYIRGDDGALAFLGIPCADGLAESQSPGEPWNHTLDATGYGPACTQPGQDCLRVNVFTPTIHPYEPLPVLVWFHGLDEGSSVELPLEIVANEFVANGIVFVSFSFYGFSSANTSAPNRTFSDQLRALRWIRDNIDHFGGDPNRVTLIGMEAGAVSIARHLVTPRAKGFFQRAILHGGSLLGPIAENQTRVDRAFAEALAMDDVVLPNDTEVMLVFDRRPHTIPREGNWTAGSFEELVSTILHPLGLAEAELDLAIRFARVIYAKSELRSEMWKEAAQTFALDHSTNAAGLIKFAKLLAEKKSNRIHVYSLELPSLEENRSARPFPQSLGQLWINYAKTGTPSPDEWPPFDHDSSYACLALLEARRTTVRTDCLSTVDEFWNSLVPLLRNRSIVAEADGRGRPECTDESHHGGWIEAYAYRISIAATVLVCLLVIGFSYLAIRRLKQRLKTYHLIAAVADLNFT